METQLAPPPPTTAAPTSFLAQAARDLLAQYPGPDLSDLVIVVPTRRAVVYLQNELSLAAEAGQALWSPRIAAMEDYMVQLAGVQVEEPIALQLLLFDILRDIDPKLDFDQFVGWSGLLLQDFSHLDQNLAKPQKVFEYLTQAKALERWDLALKPPGEESVAGCYFRFWDDLEKVYWRLRRRMEATHLAYPGLAYRLGVRHVREQVARGEVLPRHVFLGLSALSKAEEKLIKLLYKEGRADLRFDGDAFYLDADSPNRAGQYLRRYRKEWKLPAEAFGGRPGHGLPEWLRGLPRQVQFVGVANSSMQGKVAGQLLAESRRENPQAKVAVVLPDETLLLPVLHGLPPEAVPEYNVTMGLSFQSTPLFNLVDLLFEVHLTGIRAGSPETGYGVPRYHHLAVTKLLSHPFLRRLQPGSGPCREGRRLVARPGKPPAASLRACPLGHLLSGGHRVEPFDHLVGQGGQGLGRRRTWLVPGQRRVVHCRLSQVDRVRHTCGEDSVAIRFAQQGIVRLVDGLAGPVHRHQDPQHRQPRVDRRSHHVD